MTFGKHLARAAACQASGGPLHWMHSVVARGVQSFRLRVRIRQRGPLWEPTASDPKRLGGRGIAR